MKPLEVLLVDDHPLVRAGLKLLIHTQPDMRVIAEAGTVAEGLLRAQENPPDIVVLDISMPGQSGLQGIERFRSLCAQTRVLVLTMHDEAPYLRAALAAGCAGYIVKSAIDKDLLLALRMVRAGRPFVFLNGLEETPRPWSAARTGPRADPGAPELSGREREVLRWLAQGYTNQQTADRLFLSVKTVETYRQRIAQKLGLRDRAALVRYGIEMGILDRSSDDLA